MSGNTESTSNSLKFAPMPMSALLANLMPLQSQQDSPDNSGDSGDDSDSSFGQTVTRKPSSPKPVKKEFSTPLLKSSKPKDIKAFASEQKIVRSENNKENSDYIWSSNQTYPNKDSLESLKVSNNNPPNPYSNSEVKKRSALMPHNNNGRSVHSHVNSAIKKTPEIKPPMSSNKIKSATPKIKSGIRKFTPGSGRHSNKKTPLNTVIQNRDKVRCELFTHKKDEPSKPENPVPVPVPETPMNRKPMPASYVATPSYPQGVIGGNSKILFKTTSIKDKKYIFIKKLGTGGSSEVYKVLEVGTSCEYAVKCVYLATDQELAQGYINEVRLLRELQNSDRVIRLFDYEYDRQNQFLRMVLEVGETDLSSFMRARGAGLPPALVLHYWEEMLHAVHYIHEHGVIHADLKPANFLLVSGRLKLIDFGIASAISSDATSVVRAQATGTYSYISPEALMGGAGGYGVTNGHAPIKISFRSDVWSLGCILYSMVYGRTPFGHIPNLAKLAAILDPNHRIEYPPVEHKTQLREPPHAAALAAAARLQQRQPPPLPPPLQPRPSDSAHCPLKPEPLSWDDPHVVKARIILAQILHQFAAAIDPEMSGTAQIRVQDAVGYLGFIDLPASLISALKWCLTYNARARPTVRELLSIPYLQPAAAKPPLPQALLDKLQTHLTPQEYRLLIHRLQ